MNVISNPLILVLVIDFSYQSNQSKLNGKKVFFKNRKGEAAETNTTNIPTATISEIEEDSFFIGNDPCCQIEGLSFSNYYYTIRCYTIRYYTIRLLYNTLNTEGPAKN